MSKGSNPRRVGGRDRRWRQLRAQGLPCHLCGYPIDYDAHHMAPTSFVMDELVPVCRGGSCTDPDNTFPAHRCCNSWRGAKHITPKLRSSVRARFEREVLPNRCKPRKADYRCSKRW